MLIVLHKNACTTPTIRAELARRFGLSEATGSKWKTRTEFHDRSHTAHRLQKTLTPAQKVIAVELRQLL